MGYKSPQLPTRVQSHLSSFLLIGLSLSLAPLSAFITAWTLFTRKRIGRDKQGSDSRPTAMVNGGRMQKCLFVSRALAKQGYRVVVVEEEGWGLLSPARFSSFVDKFILVPSGGGQRYIDALVDVALSEDVCLFVPCSGAGTTGEDALAADILRKESTIPDFKAIIQDADLIDELHEKDKFITLVLDKGLEAPHSVLVDSQEELIDLLKKPDQPPRILKCAAELDDIGRSDLTLYPLRNQSNEVDWIATERRIQTLPIPISSKTPYIAQEFIGGNNTSEWCTHSTIINGGIKAFVCCPSNDMLMTYYPTPHSHPMTQRTLEWTKDFIKAIKSDPKYNGKSLDGHYSFDFIHQPSPKIRIDHPDFFALGRLVAIECNPRVHTAVGLISTTEEFGQAYTTANSNVRARSKPNAKPMSWLAHDIPARLLPLIIPHFIRSRIHPFWIKASEVESNNTALLSQGFNLDAPGSRDAAWDPQDPVPFFAFYHLMWPYLILRQVFVKQRAWSRINVSTARIFEC
ncbi:unnamed protein product [Sympodiomycopsis kandeliae]